MSPKLEDEGRVDKINIPHNAECPNQLIFLFAKER